MKIIELGKPAYCKRINAVVTPTHCIIDRDGGKTYLVAPKGLKDDGLPLDSFGCAESDITDAGFMEVPDIDKSYFDAEVTTPSGFKGIITDFIFHLGGCVHAQVFNPKPNKAAKSGKTWNSIEVDIRLLIGKGIKKLKEACLKKDEPSPAGVEVSGTLH